MLHLNIYHLFSINNLYIISNWDFWTYKFIKLIITRSIRFNHDCLMSHRSTAHLLQLLSMAFHGVIYLNFTSSILKPSFLDPLSKLLHLLEQNSIDDRTIAMSCQCYAMNIHHSKSYRLHAHNPKYWRWNLQLAPCSCSKYQDKSMTSVYQF